MPTPRDPMPPADARSDGVLARRAGLGDREAFTAIYRRHGAALFRHAVRLLDGDRQAAEDAVQEAWTRAWLKMGDLRSESAVRSWLFRLTINECHSGRRRRRPIAVDDEILTPLVADATDDPSDRAVVNDLTQNLTLALTELPWQQRAAWLLREIEELSYLEIADALDTSVAAVRGQLHRARATLAVRMAQWR